MISTDAEKKWTILGLKASCTKNYVKKKNFEGLFHKITSKSYKTIQAIFMSKIYNIFNSNYLTHFTSIFD